MAPWTMMMAILHLAGTLLSCWVRQVTGAAGAAGAASAAGAAGAASAASEAGAAGKEIPNRFQINVLLGL